MFDYTLKDDKNNADKAATEYKGRCEQGKIINEIKKIIKKTISTHLTIYNIRTRKIVARKCSQYRIRYSAHDIILCE